MRAYSRRRTGVLALFLVSLLPDLAHAQGAVGRVTFVGTLGEEVMPDGSAQARFRFRLSESSCGTTDGVWMRRRSGTTWGDWEALPPAPVPITSDPAAVVQGQNTIEVFALGSDNRIYWTTWGTQWSGWTVVPGPQTFKSGPAVASRGPSSLDLFAVNTVDTALWRNVWNGTSWQGWGQVSPVPIQGNPEAIARSSTRVDVFARQFDNTMGQITWTGTFGSWTAAGVGLFNSGAAVTSELVPSDRMDLFALGTTDVVFTSRRTGTAPWSAWNPVAGERLASDPAAVIVGSRTEVFAREVDGRLSTIAVPVASGQGWTPLGDQRFAGGPAAVSFAGRVHLLARGGARAERYIHVRSGKIDAGSGHTAVNFRNAYNTVLSAFLARTVAQIQVDVPSCDPTVAQTISLPAAAIGLVP